jgi:hypothetical protein
MVAREEGANIMSAGTATTQDWDAAWESDGEDKEEIADGRNRQSIEEQRRVSEVYSKSHLSLNNGLGFRSFGALVTCKCRIHLATALRSMSYPVRLSADFF